MAEQHHPHQHPPSRTSRITTNIVAGSSSSTTSSGSAAGAPPGHAHPHPPAQEASGGGAGTSTTAAASSEAATRSRRGTAVTPPATSSLLAAKLKICSAVNRAHTRERVREHSVRAALRRERDRERECAREAGAGTTGKPGAPAQACSPRGVHAPHGVSRRDSLVRADSKRGKKPRERWLLTRKTWRYMADAGRRLIPDGSQNRAEDVPRIEAYFQEACLREPRFLLWRKSSYPGALGFRTGGRSRSRAGRKKGGSCRDSRDKSGCGLVPGTSASADEADEAAAAARGGGAVFLQPVLGREGSGRFDVQRAKKEFLEAGPAPTRLGYGDGDWDQQPRDSSASEDSLDPEDKLLLDTLEMYLARDEAVQRGEGPPPPPPPGSVLDEQELLDKLRLRLESILGPRDQATAGAHGGAGAAGASADDRDAPVARRRPEGVPFNGDHVQKQLLETLRRYYGKSTARQKVISDLLTERKLLERLLFDTRRARGFAYRRGGAGAPGREGAYVSSMSRTDPRWRQQAAQRGGRDASGGAYGAYDYPTGPVGPAAGLSRVASRRLRGAASPPPLIEVHPEGEPGEDEESTKAASARTSRPARAQRGTQTDPLTAAIIAAVDEERKRRAQEEADEEDGGGGRPRGSAASRRRSSVDNDDVSPSVSDTIKRYLRMARKKSMDGDKADRFKRVNYDRNLRNIKAKGEITLPGDDDGLNKGAQTDESWVNVVKDLKYECTGVGSNPDTDDLATTSSRLTSSRSSFDTTATGGDELGSPSQVSPATTSASSTPLQSPKSIFSSGQSFLSHLLHGLHQQQQLQQQQQQQQQLQQQQPGPGLTRQGSASPKEGAGAAGSGASGASSGAVSAGAMQKSKSSSSVVQSLEKIWKTRSKSHSRASGSGPGAGPGAAHEGGAPTPCSWTPQGNCTWSCGSRRVQLAESTPLLQLTEVERQVLQKVALAKLQALNLGVAVRIPSEKVAAEAAAKPKRRAYLLKRKALTTGVVDGRKDPDKDNPASGLVFGLPLTQCIENERGPRSPSGARSQASAGSGGSGPGRGSGSRGTGLAGLVGLGGRGGASRSSAGAADDGGSVELRRKSHHGSRASFSSLVEAPRHDDAGSVEDLLGGPMAGSVPGQLNSLSSATSATDFLDDEMADLVTEPPRLPWVPHVVNTCLRHLTTHGLHTLGIFRVSSSKKRVRQLREEFDGGQDTSLDDDLCPHDVATLLKEYFRDLPDPLLCRDLYQAFVQTQRIRNRRLQAEALQHLVQLLPPAHRDTLHSLLAFLGEVARNAADRRDDASGDWLTGNRMDSSNLATLFAPNILHCNAPAAAVSAADELSAERAEERADTINVVRSMIDNSEFLFQVPAELLDEAYMHMMDSHPQALDYLLRRRAAEAGEDIEPDADEHAERSERRVWSREEFLHERCATPADDEPVSRGSRRSGGGSRRRSRVDSAGDSADSGTASGSGPGVITASLKIPVPGVGVGPGVGSGAAFALSVDDSDIPYIEDGVQDGSGRHQVTVGLVRGSLTGSSLAGGGGVGPAAGSLSQRRRQRSGSGSVASDSSTTTTGTTTGGAAASQGTRDSAVGSYSSPPRNSSSSPPSWTSSPPLSPDPLVRNVNYIPDVVTQPAAGQDLAGRRAAYSRTASTSSEHHVQTTTLTPGVVVQRVTFTSIGDADVPAAAAPAPAMTPATVTAMAGIGGRRDREPSKPSTYQRILSSLTGHVHAATAASSGSELAKSATTSFIGSTAFDEREVKDFRDFREEVATAGAGAGFVRQERDRIITPSISSIGGAVLRSKTADIERMLRISRSSGAAANATTTGSASEDKKKYTKRRYTRHIPEADSLATVAASRTLSGGGGLPQAGVGAAPLGAALGAGGGPGAGGVPGGPRGSTTQGPVWKRRELIASDPKRHGAI